ncbi:MAG: DUF814 domain-containing protein [Candidatus Cloacimonetes bacterium]|nr:DUF814 domain-containing protein [Candidatus Cloacimonadota bacterium]
MKYKFLSEWLGSIHLISLNFKELLQFEDQYLIKFSKTKKNLQICLASENCFQFFTEKSNLPFAPPKGLSKINNSLKNTCLKKIELADNDRIFFLTFQKTDIYNQKITYQLIIELIPHYQNIILTQLSENTSSPLIIDCLRKVSFAENKHRQILPGFDYSFPPSGYENKLEKIIYPLSINEKKGIVENSQNSKVYREINKLFEDLYYEHILVKKREKSLQKRRSEIQKKINKLERKLIKQEKELLNAQNEDIWKQKAELLKANFSKIKPGMNSISLKNYYLDGFPEIEITLQSDKSISRNIDLYFKKYKKAKKGKKVIAEQITKTKSDIEFLRKKDIMENNFEFPSQKVSPKNTQKEKSYKKLVIDENWGIFIGRTSMENDHLTTKFAKPNDWWFHTRVYRGTHVILRNLNKSDLPDNLKIICCRLAAYYSKAKKSSNVPVDYTQIRFVRKPKGSPTGFVTYTNQKTLFVDPLSMREAALLFQMEKTS